MQSVCMAIIGAGLVLAAFGYADYAAYESQLLEAKKNPYVPQNYADLPKAEPGTFVVPRRAHIPYVSPYGQEIGKKKMVGGALIAGVGLLILIGYKEEEAKKNKSS